MTRLGRERVVHIFWLGYWSLGVGFRENVDGKKRFLQGYCGRFEIFLCNNHDNKVLVNLLNDPYSPFAIYWSALNAKLHNRPWRREFFRYYTYSISTALPSHKGESLMTLSDHLESNEKADDKVFYFVRMSLIDFKVRFLLQHLHPDVKSLSWINSNTKRFQF